MTGIGKKALKSPLSSFC